VPNWDQKVAPLTYNQALADTIIDERTVIAKNEEQEKEGNEGECEELQDCW